jgi:hypothetical protein
LLTVDSGAPEKESIVTSRSGVVVAFIGGAVAVARSMGIWEREREKMREKAGAVREREVGAGAPCTCMETEKNFDPDHSFTNPKIL